MATLFVAFLNPACSVLVGNVKPVDEKSKNYKILQLDQRDSDWHRLKAAEMSQETDPQAEQSQNPPGESDSSESADLAYQSQTTSSIISMNSACRPSVRERELQEFTQQLLLGISDITEKLESQSRVAGLPALQTTITGKMSRTSVKIRTVVLKKEGCAFDLTYIAKPSEFEKQSIVFSQFVDSLVIK